MSNTSIDYLAQTLQELTELRETVRKTLRGRSRETAYATLDRAEGIIGRIHTAQRLDAALRAVDDGSMSRAEFLELAGELAKSPEP